VAEIFTAQAQYASPEDTFATVGECAITAERTRNGLVIQTVLATHCHLLIQLITIGEQQAELPPIATRLEYVHSLDQALNATVCD
jgi:hypothetical protein